MRHLGERPPQGERATLLQQYGWIVRRIATRVARRLPAQICVDDLTSAGTVGLLDALARFDDADGNFVAYAHLRVHGAIMDELRQLDWVPRSTRAKAGRLAAAVDRLEGDLGRTPTDDELAEALDLSLSDLHTLRDDATVGVLTCSGCLSEEGDFFDAVPAETPDPEALVMRQSQRDWILRALTHLDAREQIVLRRSYLEGARLKQIGTELGLTESRVSQLRSKALRRLRTMATWQAAG